MVRQFHFWRLLTTAFLVTASLLVGLPGAYASEEGEETDPVEAAEAAAPSWLDGQPDEPPTIAFGDLEPGLEGATDQLEQNFSGFLDRRPLGFDDQLWVLLREDIDSLYQTVVQAVDQPAEIKPATLLDVTIPLIALALFLVLFFAIDRYATQFAHRAQARTHLNLPAWVTTLVRRLILVLGRSAAFVVLILLSYFPLRALFAGAGWTLLVTDALYLFLAYRIIKTLLVTGLRLHPHSGEAARQFKRLERFALFVLRVTLGFLVVLSAINRLDYHPELAELVTFAFRVALAVMPLYLFRTRDAVLNLLPPQPSSRLYRTLHGAIARNYYAVLTITVVLLGFNAAGYIEAAIYLLTRGYVLLLAAALWFAIIERLHHHVVERARQATEAGEPPSPLPEAFEQWLVAIGSLVILVFALRLLGLYEALLALLETPILGVGRVQISLANLVYVVLIVVGTYLSVRLLKAILNAKIYPAFGVDIGIAYAVNTLINYALVVVAFVLCLVALGVQLSAVMVVLASLGVGIGFGLQNIAENLVSGFILLFGRAVQKGDFITVNDLYGRVEAVGARSVVVRTPDNFSMLIPSKEIVSGRIVNWTFQDSIARIHIPVGVAYDSDPALVRDTLLETAADHPDILDEPQPDVWIVEFADSSIVFELLVYFDCRETNEHALKGKFNFLIWEAFRNAGIEIPFPQRDLHLKSTE